VRAPAPGGGHAELRPPAGGTGSWRSCPRRAAGALQPGRWLVEALVAVLFGFLAVSAVWAWP
jgi:hypothetical protein